MADKPAVPNNVYTVLVIIAMIGLLAAVVYVCMRSTDLFGNWNPAKAEGLKAMIQMGLRHPLG